MIMSEYHHTSVKIRLHKNGVKIRRVSFFAISHFPPKMEDEGVREEDEQVWRKSKRF